MHRRERCASAPMTMDRARASQTGACFRAGARLASLKMTGTAQEQQQDDRHADGEDDALERDGSQQGALLSEKPFFREQRTGKDIPAPKSTRPTSARWHRRLPDGAPCAAGKPEEGQRADHDERAEDKAERVRSRTLARNPFLYRRTS